MRITRSMPVLAVLLGACAAPTLTFSTPDAALQALVDSAEDPALAEQLLGPGGFEVLRSGDDVADREDLHAVRELMAQGVRFEPDDADRRVAVLGEAAWPLPLPLVRAADGWRFDVEAGKDEILSRRIGRNELATIETLRACVEAQREYEAEGRDGNPPAFAARWGSSEGMHDGLYWPTADGEPSSPLGPLVAQAAAAGYQRSSTGEPVPYQGYHFRMLTTQGEHAPGGARSYADDDGLLRSGFAFLAWPAIHGNSGIMTFLVNHQGIVFERDLGDRTAEAVSQITSYDPDENWHPVVD